MSKIERLCVYIIPILQQRVIKFQVWRTLYNTLKNIIKEYGLPAICFSLRKSWISFFTFLKYTSSILLIDFIHKKKRKQTFGRVSCKYNQNSKESVSTVLKINPFGRASSHFFSLTHI